MRRTSECKMFRILFALQGTTEMIMRFLVFPAELWQQRRNNENVYNLKCASQEMKKKKNGIRFIRQSWDDEVDLLIDCVRCLPPVWNSMLAKLFEPAKGDSTRTICPEYFCSLRTHNSRQSGRWREARREIVELENIEK